jgi:hypothetical protein
VKKYIEQNDNKNRMFQEIYILNKSSVNIYACYHIPNHHEI